MKTLVTTEKGFEIYFEALEEHTPLSELLPEETEEQLKETYNNNCIFLAKVTAEKAGVELSSDHLGGCIYESEEDFYTKYKDDYFADMKATVIEEAEKELKVLIEELKK